MARPPEPPGSGGSGWVEVAYALPDRQRVVRLELPAGGLTAAEALQRSGLVQEFPEIGPAPPLGVFGAACRPTRPLRAGDRLEIYRPLRNDPRAARRARAAQARSASGDRR
jgi:putative ubiquitin-RnfH superfamily antitoxin RatB of RatAB toxin-antitoxin module